MADTSQVPRMQETREEPEGVVLITKDPIVMRTTPDRPTWAQLVASEPRLGALLAEARDGQRVDRGRYCANEAYFGYGRCRGGGIKPRLGRLVGWYAESDDPALRTSDAYDAAYHAIYDAPPACRGCDCPVAG